MRIRILAVCAAALLPILLSGQSTAVALPTGPLTFGAFVAQFRSDGTFSLEGRYPGEWSPFKGTWKATAAEVELLTSGGDAQRMRRRRALSVPHRQRPCHVRRRRRWLQRAPHDHGRQLLAAGRRGGHGPGTPLRPHHDETRVAAARRSCSTEAGRRSAAHRQRALPTDRIFPTHGMVGRAGTSCGARRYRAWRIRVPSCGAIASS